MFLSAVWTLILTAPIHRRASIGEPRCNATFLQICSDEETNSSTSWMTWGRGWAHFQQMFIFGWTPLLIHVTLHTHSSFKTRRRPQKLLNGYKCHHLICDIFETFLSQSFIWQMYRNHCFHIYIYISFFSCYCFTVKCIGWICPLKHDNTFIYSTCYRCIQLWFIVTNFTWNIDIFIFWSSYIYYYNYWHESHITLRSQCMGSQFIHVLNVCVCVCVLIL